MKDMARIPGGTFAMGAADFYPDEAPVHAAHVDDFLIDRHPVTVREFRRFVGETGYVTVAERPLDQARLPGVEPGSLVFVKPPRRVPLGDVRAWWKWVDGATWRTPHGPGSSVAGRDRHPVTQVAWEDACAYASWAGKALPTEAEWERAARGGLDGALFAWGDEERPGGRLMANHWQGEFPWLNRRANGYEGTSPVGAFPPNGFGLYDVCGNVWEWTADLYRVRHADPPPKPCCAPPPADGEVPRRVIKGGSHLCAPSYCLRYRPAARQGEAVDTSTTHIGFRCVVR